MDNVESDFLEAEDIKPQLWLRYIDDIFSFGQKAKINLKTFFNI